MSKTVKIVVYVVLITLTIFFGLKTLGNYKAIMDAPMAEEPAEVTPEGEQVGKSGAKTLGGMMTYGILTFFCFVGLAFLISRDISRFVAHRAEHFLMSDDGEALRDPEYEQAEQVWADGNFLEAIQLMREYLKKNPRELHVALRIAEIYENDLQNHLAAALEYEEVIKHKLPAERWGWAAIHLANLYSGKLNRSEQALELLRRVVKEYGHTAAAKKARRRLAADDPAFGKPPEEEESESNLPPGFKRK